VTLLIRPAPNTDNAEFYETAKAYSELFEVVGILLDDDLTKLKCFWESAVPKSRGPMGNACRSAGALRWLLINLWR